jgi:hypothetical protein
MTSTDRRRLAAILGMLGSEFDGERAAAGLQAETFRKKHGLTWEQMLATPPPEAVRGPEPEPPPSRASEPPAGHPPPPSSPPPPMPPVPPDGLYTFAWLFEWTRYKVAIVTYMVSVTTGVAVLFRHMLSVP